MKTRYIIGSLIVVVFAAIAFFSLKGSEISYTDLATAQEMNKRVQVKGVWVKEKGAEYNNATNEFTFTMRDDKNVEVPVLFHGARPNNFDIAESIVVKGKIENGTFVASDILTKCPSKYEGGGEHLKEMQDKKL